MLKGQGRAPHSARQEEALSRWVHNLLHQPQVPAKI